MSALCIVTTPDAVTIATDGGSFRADGTLAGVAGKTVLFPEASTAITHRGPRRAFDEVVDAVRNSVPRLDLDAILDAAPHYAERAAGRLGGERSEFCFAGWSERRGAHETWAVRSHDAEDAEAFAPVRLPECYAPNEAPPEIAAEFGLRMPSTGERQWRADPFRWAALLIAALRFCPAMDRAGDGEGHIIVGGFVQVSRISRHAAASEIVQEWPDDVGRRIDPEVCLRGLTGQALAERIFGRLGEWRADHAH